MKAVLLLIELKRNLEFSEPEIRYLMKKLPAGCEKVVHGARSIGFLMPSHDILLKMRARLRHALEPFANYWFIGLSGEVVCFNGSLDPLASAIKQYSVAPLRSREAAETKNVPLREPWKPRR